MNYSGKVALVQDWFVIDGGAEKVFKELLNLFPEADVYSLIDFLDDNERTNILHDKKSTTSVIQSFPFAKKHYRYYLKWFPYAIEQLDLSKYDLIISSSYAVAKGVLTHAEQIHICYCHSPMRYIWDLYHAYMPKSKWHNFPKTCLMRSIISKLRIWDVVSSNRVDYFIANSENVARRIKKVYRRESEVIYPPVQIDEFKLQTQKEDYYVTASRLVGYKKVDLIVKAFQDMPDKKLVVIGKGPELSKIKALTKGHKNIEVKGFVTHEVLIQSIQNAKAFINASNEDFGISPVEAQACGTPVIGFGKGGLLETTVEGKTAIYFAEQSIESLKNAVKFFEESNMDSAEAISEFAKKFDRSNFHKQLKSFIQHCLEKQHA